MYTIVPFRTRREISNPMNNPFDDRFFRSFFDMNDMVGSAGFRVDVKEQQDNYLLEAELPGFNKEDISIDLKDGILTITATHNESSDQKGSDGSYIRREPRYGSFARSFDVTGIDERGITAAYNNGVLSLTLPKFKPAEPETHRIAIQ